MGTFLIAYFSVFRLDSSKKVPQIHFAPGPMKCSSATAVAAEYHNSFFVQLNLIYDRKCTNIFESVCMRVCRSIQLNNLFTLFVNSMSDWIFDGLRFCWLNRTNNTKCNCLLLFLFLFRFASSPLQHSECATAFSHITDFNSIRWQRRKKKKRNNQIKYVAYDLHFCWSFAVLECDWNNSSRNIRKTATRTQPSPMMEKNVFCLA